MAAEGSCLQSLAFLSQIIQEHYSKTTLQKGLEWVDMSCFTRKYRASAYSNFLRICEIFILHFLSSSLNAHKVALQTLDNLNKSHNY